MENKIKQGLRKILFDTQDRFSTSNQSFVVHNNLIEPTLDLMMDNLEKYLLNQEIADAMKDSLTTNPMGPAEATQAIIRKVIRSNPVLSELCNHKE
jgi:hypothetical protein